MPMTKEVRTAVYVDGLNLYYALDELGKPHLKWLNLRSLSESLLREGDCLTQVNCYTAYPTWLLGPYATHRSYVKALQAESVKVILGKFKDKHAKCRKCHARYQTKEEKQTDVNIALGLVVDGIQDKYDRAILISADTDLVVAVKRARELNPRKEVFIAVPENRYRQSREFERRHSITAARFGKHLLAAEYKDANGRLIVKRPAKYDPPP